MVILRVIAVLIGLVLVLGGGVCTLVGVPTGVSALFSGAAAGALPILFATAVGFVVLLIGLRMLKFGGGKALTQPTESVQPGQFNPEGYLGKYFLIVVNSIDAHNQPQAPLRMHGYADEITESGVRVALRGRCQGQFWTVPLDGIRAAQLGSFTIQDTGEVVNDPDFIAHMTTRTEVPTVPAAL